MNYTQLERPLKMMKNGSSYDHNRPHEWPLRAWKSGENGQILGEFQLFSMSIG